MVRQHLTASQAVVVVLLTLFLFGVSLAAGAYGAIELGVPTGEATLLASLIAVPNLAVVFLAVLKWT